MIRVGIIGGAGYTGGELLRILINHPYATISYASSKSNAGNKIGSVHQDLFHSDLIFSEGHHYDIDVLFLCAGHGAAITFLQQEEVPNHIKIIDLSNDFRLNDSNSLRDRSFVYGLPEINLEAIKTAQNIANPGCFATAIQLGLLPLAAKGLVGNVYTTGITGATGAGQSLSATSHFPWRDNNVSAYKTLTHQHLGEISESIAQLQGNANFDISFVPWRGDFSRGIFISSQLECELSSQEVVDVYTAFYAGAPFTHVSESGLHLKQVVNTNYCALYLEKIGNKLVVHSAIDNLLKGASGQAVQNMNIMYGLDQTTGLNIKANLF